MTAISELEGFTVYRAVQECRDGFFLSSGDSNIRISTATAKLLGDPEYVVLFFDEKKKRVMITAANQKMENTIKLRKGSHTDHHRTCLNHGGVNKLVRKLAGAKDEKTTYRAPGHAIEGVEGKIIFELSRAVEFRAAR